LDNIDFKTQFGILTNDVNIVKSLLIMSYMWTAATFFYYVITYKLKYLPGDIFDNSIAAAVAEVIGCGSFGFLFAYLKIKKSLILLFFIQMTGSTLILVLGDQIPMLMPIFVLLARLGSSAAMTLLHIATVEIFPTLVAATAFGICNVIARIACIFGPLLVEVPEPVPMSIISFMSLIAISLSFRLQEGQNKDSNEQKNNKD